MSEFNGIVDGPFDNQVPNELPCNGYVGINYVPCKPDDAHQGVPEQVLNWGGVVPRRSEVGVGPCTELCATCMDEGCHKCTHCPVHVDPKDKSMTILHLSQSSKTPVPQRVYFVLGETAYPIYGGVSFCFNGKTMHHGVWAPPDVKGWDWTGLAFVQR